jgi:hypothetical protein
VKDFEDEEYCGPCSDAKTREKVKELLTCLLWGITKYYSEVNGNIIELSKHDHSGGEIVPLADTDVPILEDFQGNHGSWISEDGVEKGWDGRG